MRCSKGCFIVVFSTTEKVGKNIKISTYSSAYLPFSAVHHSILEAIMMTRKGQHSFQVSINCFVSFWKHSIAFKHREIQDALWVLVQDWHLGSVGSTCNHQPGGKAFSLSSYWQLQLLSCCTHFRHLQVVNETDLCLEMFVTLFATGSQANVFKNSSM